MNWEAAFTILVVVGVFVALIRNYAADMVLLAGTVILTLGGVISPAEAFTGFSNDGMLTVAALFVCAAGLRETGALDSLGSMVLGRASTERSALLRLSTFTTLISAFLNNTPVVAMFIPVITGWCKKHNVSPSRLLLPLSYFTILGGTCTLIGTSTNIVVKGLVDNTAKALTPEQLATHPGLGEQLRSLGLFEVTYLGLPYAVVGCVYLFFIGYRLLPVRADFLEQMSRSAREYLVDLRVTKGCSLIGRSVEDAGLRRLRGLFLIEIERGDQIISPVSPDQLLQEGDLLTFTGEVSTIVDLERIQGLVPVGDEGDASEVFTRRGRMLCEAVVSSTSPVLGKTIRDSGFRALYNAAVVAVHRGGERLRGRVGDIVLRAGDTLLLQAGPHFLDAHRYSPDFFLASGIEDSREVRHEKAWISLALLGLLVAMMASGYVPIVLAAFLVAGLMVVTGCISIADARQSIEWQTLIAIASSFGIGKALENSGVVHDSIHALVGQFGGFGPVFMLAILYLATGITTELITNNAAAVLLFPFSLQLAHELDVSPRPFIIAVMFAASASFSTPIGYQTNLMVFGPGGYRFTDYFRVGIPLNVILWLFATVAIPFIWPF